METPMNLTASDRNALIRLANSLPRGSKERRAILAGLKTAKPSASDILKALKGGNSAVPWTATEVWAEVQSKYPKEQAEDIVKEQLEWSGWPEDDDEAFALRDKIEKEVVPVQRLLEDMWKKGDLVRIKVRGGGGEWAVPGTKGAKGGVSFEDWK